MNTRHSFFTSQAGSRVWRQHPLTVLIQVVPSIFLAAALTLIPYYLQVWWAWLLPATPLVWTFRAWWDWRNRIVLFRPSGMIIREGILNQYEQLIPIHRINSVSIDTSLLCRILNSGHLSVRSSADQVADVAMRWVHPISTFAQSFERVKAMHPGISPGPMPVEVQIPRLSTLQRQALPAIDHAQHEPRNLSGEQSSSSAEDADPPRREPPQRPVRRHGRLRPMPPKQSSTDFESQDAESARDQRSQDELRPGH